MSFSRDVSDIHTKDTLEKVSIDQQGYSVTIVLKQG